MCDATVSPWVVSLAGSALMIMCYAFIGPAPYLAFFEPNFTTVCSSLVAQGSFTMYTLHTDMSHYLTLFEVIYCFKTLLFPYDVVFLEAFIT